jgi:hypothetical protein
MMDGLELRPARRNAFAVSLAETGAERSFWAMPDNTTFGSRGRNRSLPDYSDFIGVRVRGPSSSR